ncbi:MAG: UDP binding domain-containing protein [Candidatus Omnitrophica bacterium]|nr:UDP binding domain-containing protein [Candidatus Omnitrophota bacterium]
MSNKFKLPSYLIKAVNSSNSFHKKWTEKKCHQVLKNFRKKNVAILGLAYKPGIDTLRRSPALELAKSLHAKGATVKGFDPIIKSVPRDISKVIGLKKSVKEAVIDAEVVVIAADCPEFLHFDSEIMNLIKKKFIIDPNGFIANLSGFKKFNYICVGRNYKEGSRV